MAYTTDSLINIDFNKKSIVNYRTFSVANSSSSSININQITGDFVVTYPSLNSGTIILYPQSPNNPTTSLLGEVKTFTSFSTIGNISGPLDAKFDSVRGKIWIADTGNNRVIKLDYASLTPDLVINIDYPFCVIPNINTGGVFIRSYSNLTGYMNYYLASGTITNTFSFVDILPSNYNSQCSAYDYRRNRLWYIGESTNNVYADIVIMIDFSNKQTSYIALKYLPSDIESSAKMIDVDVDSGNAFVVGHDSNANKDYLFQIFRDNNVILSKTYLPKSEVI